MHGCLSSGQLKHWDVWTTIDTTCIKLADSVPLSLCQTETGNLELDRCYTMLSSCLHEYLHAHRYTHILLIFTFYYCSFKKYCLLKIGGFENPLARKFENNSSTSELEWTWIYSYRLFPIILIPGDWDVNLSLTVVLLYFVKRRPAYCKLPSLYCFHGRDFY